jgi:uncharacterized protein
MVLLQEGFDVMKNILKRLFTAAFVLFALLNIVAAMHAWKLTHFYANAPKPATMEQLSIWQKTKVLFTGIKTPKPTNTDSFSISHQNIVLKTADSLNIMGWYAPQNNAKGAVALFHGHLATKAAVVQEANAFYNMGYTVLLIDFRGHGSSDGNYCTIGYKEAEEVKLAHDFLKAKGEHKIILWGVSMGAAAITSAFNSYNLQPSGIILELPFGSLHQAVAARTKQMGLPAEPVATLLTFWGGVENGFNALSFAPAMYAKKITCPVLLQAGKIDKRVSLTEIDVIYNNLATAQKKKVVYDNAGHQSLFANQYAKWNKEVKGFFGLLQ